MNNPRPSPSIVCCPSLPAARRGSVEIRHPASCRRQWRAAATGTFGHSTGSINLGKNYLAPCGIGHRAPHRTVSVVQRWATFAPRATRQRQPVKKHQVYLRLYPLSEQGDCFAWHNRLAPDCRRTGMPTVSDRGCEQLSERHQVHGTADQSPKAHRYNAVSEGAGL